MRADADGNVNRFVVALLALLVIFGALLVIMLTWVEPEGAIGRVEDFARILRDHNDRDGKLILTLAGIVVILLMLCVLLLELMRPSSGQMRVQNVDSGAVAITTKEIAGRIDAEVRQVQHVSDCATTVTRRGPRVEVVLDLHLDREADLAVTADEACRRAQQLVEERLGIELAARPRARVHDRELRLQAEPAPSRPVTGWERPVEPHMDEETRDDRRSADAPEEAQAETG
jgi:hypothetical protein